MTLSAGVLARRGVVEGTDGGLDSLRSKAKKKPLLSSDSSTKNRSLATAHQGARTELCVRRSATHSFQSL